jgi:hypothetical protein
MGQIACDPMPVDAGYPPVRMTTIDAAKQVQIAALQKAAPFGWAPGQKVPVNAAQYKNAMQKQEAAARAVDFRWPFWVGIGVGSLGFVILLAKRS